MKSRSVFRYVAIAFSVMLILLTPNVAVPQGAGVALFVTNVTAPKTNPNGFPEMLAALVVPGSNGLHQPGLAVKDFTLLEDNRPVPVTGVSEQVTSAAPVAVCLAIDVSDSMGQKKNPATDKLFIEDAKDAAANFIGKLNKDKDQVCLIAFGDQDINLDSPLKFDEKREMNFTQNSADVDKLQAMLKDLKPDSGKRTALYDAALKAIKVTASRQFPGTRAVILFTDGKDERIGPDGATRLDGSLTTFDTLLTQASAARVPVFTIGDGDDVDPTNLKRLAVNAGANYYSANTPAELAKKDGPFDLIYEQLKKQYLVTYNSHLCRDGKDHVLQARARTPGGEAETRANFALVLIPSQPSVCLYYNEGGERKELSDNLKLRGTVNLTPQIESSEAISLTVFIADEKKSSEQQLCAVNTLPALCAWNTNKDPFGQRSLTIRTQDRRGQIGQATAAIVTEPATWIEALNEMPLAAKIALVGIPLLLILVGGLVLFRMTRRPAMCPRNLHVMPPGVTECPFCAEEDARLGASQVPPPAFPTMPPAPPPPQFGSTDVMGEVRSAEGVPPMATVSLRVQPVSIAFLVMERGTHVGKQFTLHAGDTTIGRAGTNDIVVDDPTVGRQQSKIKLEGKEYFLYDLAATNATRVNGKETRGRRKLDENDRIEMGNVSFVFKRVQGR